MDIFRFPTRVDYYAVGDDLSLSLRGIIAMMQEAAIVHSSQSGYAMADVPRTHVIWMVVRWRVKRLARAQWNENLIVETWPRSMGKVTSVRNFRIVNEKNEAVAVGESEWILVNTDTGRAARITSEIVSAYQLVDEDVFSAPFPTVENGAGEERCRLDIRRSDLDTNRHVNSLVYLDYALEALPETAVAAGLDEVALSYRAQLLPGQQVKCTHRSQGPLQVVELFGAADGHLHATAVFVSRTAQGG